MARQKLGRRPGRLGDEEDVALSAFKSFCLGAAAGRFPQLRDRDALWPLLVVLTVRKALDFRKHERRHKRGGGVPAADLDNGAELQSLFSREPSPELAVMVAENCQRLLDQLEAAPRQIAELKLEGYTNVEIAQRLGCGLRTVERRTRTHPPHLGPRAMTDSGEQGAIRADVADADPRRTQPGSFARRGTEAE